MKRFFVVLAALFVGIVQAETAAPAATPKSVSAERDLLMARIKAQSAANTELYACLQKTKDSDGLEKCQHESAKKMSPTRLQVPGSK